MRPFVIAFLAGLLVSSCSFSEWQARRLEKSMLRTLPVLFAGEHIPAIFSAVKLDSVTTLCQQYRLQLETLRAQNLSPETQTIIDRSDLLLKSYEAKIQDARSDPSSYNLGAYLKITLAQSGIPINERLRTISKQMQAADAYYAAARNNLIHPDPERTRTAIQKHLLILDFFDNELQDSLIAHGIDVHDRPELSKGIAQSKLHVKDYLAFCQSLIFEHRDSTLLRELPLKK